MNILSAYKFQIKSWLKGIFIFFSIITAMDLVGLIGNIIVKTVEADGSSVVSGQEVLVVIFAFVAGIATFSEFFHMLTQNGISRKTISLSKPLAALTVSAILTSVNLLLMQIFTLVTVGNNSINTVYSTEMLYHQYFENVGSFAGIFTNLLWTFAFCAAAITGGGLIAALMYRLPKYGKFLFWGGLWALFVIVLPIIEWFYSDGAIWNVLFDFVLFVTGVGSGNPFAMVITCSVIFAVTSALTWLLMRRMSVKK